MIMLSETTCLEFDGLLIMGRNTGTGCESQMAKVRLTLNQDKNRENYDGTGGSGDDC
jgi:hypothetical protein